MKILPILFNTEMVIRLQDDMKTATRRVIKPQPPIDFRYPQADDFKSCWWWTDKDGDDDMMRWWPSYENGLIPPYEPGDILYVRETWAKLYYVDPDGYTHYDQPMYYYAADGTPDIILRDGDGFEEDDQRIRWRPSIHMPKEAARIFLKVTDVWAERLQDCGNAQAKDEGCTCCSQFAKLWDITVKPEDRALYGWDANPWVWVIEFERTGKPEGWPHGKA